MENSPIFVEVRKAGFVNKGAELMLHSVLQKIRAEYPDASFVMAPSGRISTPFLKRSELGLYQKAWLWRYGIQWGDFAAVIPKVLRRMYGIILDKEVDIVLDAAGFSYTDHWGERSVVELARASKRWRKAGAAVILLPQALGPFTTPKIKRALVEAVNNIDLIFARDEVSYEYLISVVGEDPKIQMSPDFTNLTIGQPPSGDWMRELVCVVPNARMVDKTDSSVATGYVPFLARCIKLLRAQGRESFLLIHEGHQDEALAEQVSTMVGGIRIVREADPLKIKGLLGASYASIGSRFHGLVSALSQSVPTVGTGWSHKYEALFSDYGVRHLLVDTATGDEELRSTLANITDESFRSATIATLSAAADDLNGKTERMWSLVFDLLRSRFKGVDT